MKNFLHHLNVALYKTNKLFWHSFIRPSLITVIVGVSMFSLALVPLLFIHNEIFFYAWPVFSIIVSTFGYLSYLKYDASRRTEAVESEIIFESEYSGLAFVHDTPDPEPLTVKESLNSGFKWTLYILFLILMPLIGLSLWAVLNEPSEMVSGPNMLLCDEQFIAEVAAEPIVASFTDYSAEPMFEENVAPLDVNSLPEAERFNTYFEAGREEGVTFAGQYTVAEWSMTGWGHSMGIMDARTGTAILVPGKAVLGFEYYPDSRLVVADSLAVLKGVASSSPDLLCSYATNPGYIKPQPRYYVINDGVFSELGAEVHSQ